MQLLLLALLLPVFPTEVWRVSMILNSKSGSKWKGTGSNPSGQFLRPFVSFCHSLYRSDLQHSQGPPWLHCSALPTLEAQVHGHVQTANIQAQLQRVRGCYCPQVAMKQRLLNLPPLLRNPHKYLSSCQAAADPLHAQPPQKIEAVSRSWMHLVPLCGHVTYYTVFVSTGPSSDPRPVFESSNQRNMV